MSAVPVQALVPAPALPLRAHGTNPRGHLRLVRPEERAVRSSGALRLTVRGRRLVAAVLLLAAACVGAAVIAGGAGGVEAERSITVQSGQTLSQIATQHLPSLPVGTAVSQIQRANGMNSLHVSQGATLVIPRG